MTSAELYWPLVWMHVLLFAYWLGGDFGVYVTGGNVARADLPLAERLRFLDALMRIDILPRTGIVLLPVFGLQIATLRGAIDPPAWFMVAVWPIGFAWLAVVWAVFLRRGTAFAERLQRIDVGFRVLLIAAFVVAGGASLANAGPVHERWLAWKFLTYATLLAIGLYLRTVIRAWREALPMLRDGPNASAEALIAAGIRRGRRGAYVFWALIAITAWLGIAKPV